jgi:hypothetical protein
MLRLSSLAAQAASPAPSSRIAANLADIPNRDFKRTVFR